METLDLLKNNTEDELLLLFKNNELNVNLKELLIDSINCNKNKIAKYLLDIDTSIDYNNKYGWDAYLMAVSRNNIEVLKILKDKGIDLFKKYTRDNKKTLALSWIRSLDTLKFFKENNVDKKQVERCAEDIVSNTIMMHDYELLKYLIENYNVDITKIYYKTNDYNYTILEKTEELLHDMKKQLKRKREMVYFVDEILFQEDGCDTIVNRAWSVLNDLEEEVKDIQKYYDYVKEQFDK